MCENITEESWPGIVRDVHARMAQYVKPYLTPISKSTDLESGAPHASGSFVEVHGRHYLLTCEHVVGRAYEKGFHLAYLPRNDDFYHALGGPWFYEAEPIDLAITLINPSAWAEGEKLALRPEQFAMTHDLAPGELLTLCGYPVAEAGFSRFTGEPTVHSALIPYTARETGLPESKGYDAGIAFALDYAVERAKRVDSGEGSLPRAIGFSGSPIWDTGFVASECSQDWTPARSRVIGIARKWEPIEMSSVIIATKVEQIRRFLLEKVRDDVACRHWMERGRPEDDDVDLAYAASLIPYLS